MNTQMPHRWAWLALAYLCLALGIIGIVVPVMPTSPFVIVAAFAAARGSRRLHFRLLRDKRFGHLIRDWYRYGAIQRRVKLLAIAAMAMSSVSVVVFSPWPIVAWLTVVVIAVLAVWLWTRPEPPARKPPGRR